MDAKRIVKILEDLGLLLLLNFLFASSYLSSSSDRMIGFPYRQDAYSYMLVAHHLKDLLNNGIAPVGVTWLRYVYAGIPEVVFVDPLYAVYLSFLVMTNDFVFSWKLTAFFFCFLSSITMYYLASILVGGRKASLVSAAAYSFSQVLTFEMLQGHLSMVAGFAIIPLVVALYVRGSRNRNPLKTILSSVLLSFLAIMRPDFAYFTIAFLILLTLYHVLVLHTRVESLVHFVLLLLLVFLFSYPFLEPRYLSNTSALTESANRFGYAFYSPPPSLFITPLFQSFGVYLGVSVLFLSGVASVPSFIRILKLKARSSEEDKLFAFILLLAILFFVIGAGSLTPVYGFLSQYAPYFGILRVPTRWLIIAQLCLAILAGKGAVTATSLVKGEKRRKAVAVVTLLVIFLDLSVYISPTTYEQQGWQPIGSYSPDYAVYMFPQVSYVPEPSLAYEFVSLDRNTSFRVLSAPIVYSTSYYQFVTYLRQTNVSFADNYVQFPSKSRLQTEVYNGFRYGNFTNSIGEQMALLGVKYLIYNFYWGQWESLVTKMNRSQDLKFLLKDKGYILFQNRRFGDVISNRNLIMDSSFENDNSGWASWDVNEGLSKVDSATSHSGNASMRLLNNRIDGIAGRTQYVYVPDALRSNDFELSAWSKAQNVSGTDPLYAVRATVVYTDNSHSNGTYAHFSSGTHDWEYSSVYFTANFEKRIKYIVLSFFLRNATGTAWFDNIHLAESQAVDHWSGGFAVRTLYSDVNALLSDENKANVNIIIYRENSMTWKLKIEAKEPSSIILGESYDTGWQIFLEGNQSLILSNYQDLISFFIPEPGAYDITLQFVAYVESLRRIASFNGIALLVIIANYSLWRYRRRRSVDSHIVFQQVNYRVDL